MMLQRYPGRLFKKCTNAAITETNASTAFCVPFFVVILEDFYNHFISKQF